MVRLLFLPAEYHSHSTHEGLQACQVLCRSILGGSKDPPGSVAARRRPAMRLSGILQVSEL